MDNVLVATVCDDHILLVDVVLYLGAGGDAEELGDVGMKGAYPAESANVSKRTTLTPRGQAEKHHWFEDLTGQNWVNEELNKDGQRCIDV